MQPSPIRLGHVSLRVRDLDRSRAFYRSLFGFEELGSGSIAGSVSLGIKEPAGQCNGAAIVLAPGLPSGAELLGVDHFGFEVPTARDVDSTYQNAKAIHAQATQPRVYEGRWQTFIFDPDGYKIEVLAQDPSRPPMLAERSTWLAVPQRASKTRLEQPVGQDQEEDDEEGQESGWDENGIR